jgi:hypothetical protein
MMAKLFGWYGDETGKPTRIGVTATPQEGERLAGIPEAAKPSTATPGPRMIALLWLMEPFARVNIPHG